MHNKQCQKVSSVKYRRCKSCDIVTHLQPASSCVVCLLPWFASKKWRGTQQICTVDMLWGQECCRLRPTIRWKVGGLAITGSFISAHNTMYMLQQLRRCGIKMSQTIGGGTIRCPTCTFHLPALPWALSTQSTSCEGFVVGGLLP